MMANGTPVLLKPFRSNRKRASGGKMKSGIKFPPPLAVYEKIR